MAAFNYGWGSSDQLSEPFWIRFQPCKREPKSWKEEMYAAARLLANEAGTRPLWLCSSGGIDSEVMCDAFFNQGIHFSVLTIEQTGGTNRHDIEYAIRWCQLHNVAQKIVELDMQKFLSKDIQPYAEQGYISGGMFRYMQIRILEIVESMGGYAVLGGGEQLYYVDDEKKNPGINDTYLNFEQGYSVPLEWCKRNATSHEPYFYFHTPEICLAYQQIPIVAFALEHPDVFLHPFNKYLFKRLVYHSIFPSLEMRLKYDGFENFQELKQAARQNVEKKYDSLIHTCELPISLMRAQLQDISD
jgi:hypothetical protein